jgi:hypothetical protein
MRDTKTIILIKYKQTISNTRKSIKIRKFYVLIPAQCYAFRLLVCDLFTELHGRVVAERVS